MLKIFIPESDEKYDSSHFSLFLETCSFIKLLLLDIFLDILEALVSKLSWIFLGTSFNPSSINILSLLFIILSISSSKHN